MDSIKPVPYAFPLGLFGIQWMYLVALVLYLTPFIRQWRRLPASRRECR